MVQFVERSLLLFVTLASDLPLCKLNYVLFSLAYSLMRGFLYRKQTCTITLMHYWTDDRQLIALAPAVIESIDRLPDTADNRDMCLPHLHSRVPVRILP